MQQLSNDFLSGRGAMARPRVRYHRVIGCYTFTLGINLDLLQWAERMRGKKGPRNNGTDDLSSIIIRWMTLLQSIPNILPQRGVQRLQEAPTPPPTPHIPHHTPTPLRTASFVSHIKLSWQPSTLTYFFLSFFHSVEITNFPFGNLFKASLDS